MSPLFAILVFGAPLGLFCWLFWQVIRNREALHESKEELRQDFKKSPLNAISTWALMIATVCFFGILFASSIGILPEKGNHILWAAGATATAWFINLFTHGK